MRAVVTGGAGFIGSHVVDALVGRGDEVHVLDNLATGSRDRVSERATLHEGDIRTDAASVFEQALPEVCFHLAAQADVSTSIERPDFDADVNVVGTIRVLEAARAQGTQRHLQLDRRRHLRRVRRPGGRGLATPAALAVRHGQARRRGVPGRVEPSARLESRRPPVRQRLRAAPGRKPRGRRRGDLPGAAGRRAADHDLRRRNPDAGLRLRRRRRPRHARRAPGKAVGRSTSAPGSRRA